MSTMTLNPTPAYGHGLRRYWRHGTGVLIYRAIRKGLKVSHLDRWIEVWGHQYIAIHPWHLRVPSRAPRGMEVEEISGDHLNELLSLRPDAGDEFRRRFNAGQRCFAAYLQKRCVAFIWAVEGPGELRSSFGSRWGVPSKTVWLFDLYSDPGVLGAMPYLNSCIRRQLSDAHPQWLAGQVDFDNRRSMQGHSSLGYRVRGNIWSLRVGGFYLHLLQRTHGILPALKAGFANLPLDYFHSLDRASDADSNGIPPSEPVTAMSPEPPPRIPESLRGAAETVYGDAGNLIWLQCRCGARVPLTGDPFVCANCGAELGQRREGVPVLGPPIPYWGEISATEMHRLLREMEEGDWREAVRRIVPASLHEYILSPDRAAFEDVIDFPPDACILEVGAGLGGISTELARKYHVVAMEGVWERTRFMDLRARQDGLQRFTVLNGDVNSIPFAPRQFDAVIVNGVLEWTAMSDLQGDPRNVQIRFLQRLRSLLKPGGIIYLAIENRTGWNELRGAPDHSGMPYTSLMPRFMARWVCAHSSRYRSAFNVGYRTYTYTYYGYRRLFRQAGLRIRSTFISPEGYNLPVKMIPLQQEAIEFSSNMGRLTVSAKGRLRRRVVRMIGQEWIWRLTGSDFAFVLESRTEDKHA